MKRIVTAVFAAAGLLLAVNGWGQTTETASSTGPTNPDLGASMQEAPEYDADAAQRVLNSARERRALRQARRQQAARERISTAKPDAPQDMARLRTAKEKTAQDVAQEKAVPSAATDVPAPQAKEAVAQEKPAPAAVLPDIVISFGPAPRHTEGSQTGNHPGAQSRYSAVREGEVAVEARIEGRDAKGLPMAISAAWNPADPATVDVSPAQGSAVKITVRGTGQSNLTVSGPGFTKDLWISAIAHEGKAIQVDISQ